MTDYDQRPLEDTLLDRAVDDALDEGHALPERLPATHDFGTTAEEQRRGESWQQRLLQEEPDVDPSMVPEPREDELEVIVRGVARTGRLAASETGPTDDVIARDVGVDGGAASAEEAAMHVVEEP